jgi:hypothetical protein
VLYDRLAGGTLLVGQAAVVLGLYWRLLKRDPKPKAARPDGGLAPDLPLGSAERAADTVDLADHVTPETPPLRAEWIAEPWPLRVGVRLRF